MAPDGLRTLLMTRISSQVNLVNSVSPNLSKNPDRSAGPLHLPTVMWDLNGFVSNWIPAACRFLLMASAREAMVF